VAQDQAAKPTAPASVPAPSNKLTPPANPGAGVTPAPTLAPTPVDPAQIERWITDLNSDSYTVREAATRNLGQAGRTAVEPLVKAAEGENLEVSARAIRALQLLYFQTEEPVYSAAEKALEKLSESTRRGAARRAIALTAQQVAIQQKRAIQRLESLGAIIKYEGSPTFVPIGANGEKLIREVHLDDKWTGGDQGLSHIRHLSTQGLKVYLIEGTNVSKEGEDSLVKTVPGILIQSRGRALLGVAGATTQRGCEVLEIKSGSGAEKAGLLPGDVFVKYDGIEVKTFEDVIEATRKHRAGDKVVVEIFRGLNENPDKKSITVTLGGWRETLTAPSSRAVEKAEPAEGRLRNGVEIPRKSKD
jgi:hypothetical protein